MTIIDQPPTRPYLLYSVDSIAHAQMLSRHILGSLWISDKTGQCYFVAVLE